MSIKWRVVDCSQMAGSIGSARGAIIISPEDKPTQSIPVSDVAVILVGVKTNFSAAAVHRLMSNDVAILFCDWRGVPEGSAYPWSKHGRVGARQIAQASVSVPRKKALWAAIVKAKVHGQAKVLANCEREKASLLRSLSGQVRSGDPENVEAQAARVYWSSLFPDESFMRAPGLGGSRNNCLDYGYSVLRGHGIRAVMAAGLAPALGVFHRGRSNAFNLVDDLIEPFRPAIDEVVASLPIDASPSEREVKQILVEAADQKFLTDGVKIPAAFEKLAQSVGKYVEGDVDKVEVPHWDGPTEIVGGAGNGG